MYGDGPSIKVESAQSAMNGQDPRIKPDPDSLAPSPGPHSDDEDAGDLVFTGAQQGLYLAKVPNFLWESWEKMDDDQEIQIGTLRVEGGLGDIKRVLLISFALRFASCYMRSRAPITNHVDIDEPSPIARSGRHPRASQ